MPKRAVFARSRRELSLDVSVGVQIVLLVEQSSLESQSRGCANTPKLTVQHAVTMFSGPRNPLTRWDVSSIPANGIFLTKKLKNKNKNAQRVEND